MLQAFQNLLTNAVKFSFDGGHVWITSEGNSDVITINIKDEGIGFSSEQAKSLFWHYTTASRPDTQGEESTGIGLYLPKEY